VNSRQPEEALFHRDWLPGPAPGGKGGHVDRDTSGRKRRAVLAGLILAAVWAGGCASDPYAYTYRRHGAYGYYPMSRDYCGTYQHSGDAPVIAAIVYAGLFAALWAAYEINRLFCDP
jgi:hypothetical protein